MRASTEERVCDSRHPILSPAGIDSIKVASIGFLLSILLMGQPAPLQAAACVPVVSTQACLQEVDRSALASRLPLILVHGWNPRQVPGPPSSEIWTNFIAFATRDPALNAAYKLYTFTYYSNVAPVPTLGRALRDAIDTQGSTDTAFQSRELVIVAHSMGGLVSRYFMTLAQQAGPFRGQAGGERVRTLITLGTPHHGSKLANGPALWDKEGRVLTTLQRILDLTDADVYPAGPRWFDLNRTDMFWDSFGNVFDYERFPSERNVFLDTLNRDTRYNGKVIAYAGVVTPCSVFIGGYCALATVLSAVFGDSSDGIVSVSSALYSRSIEDPRSQFRATRLRPEYDHSQLATGGGFSDLRTDLLASTGSQPPGQTQPCTVVTIAVSSTVNGQLSDSDCAAPHRTRSRGDLYRVQLTSGQRVRISMEGGSLLDPYLLLVSPAGTVVAEDDDSGSLLDAAIEYTATATGSYTIEASAYDAEDRGTYSLAVMGVSITCSPISISLNSIREGSLTSSDCVAPHRSGARADVYQFSGQAGQRITVRMTGISLSDPYLILLFGATVIARDDDSAGGLNAAIQVTLASTGTYQIEATTYDETGRGTYRLELFTGISLAAADGRRYWQSTPKKQGKEVDQRPMWHPR